MAAVIMLCHVVASASNGTSAVLVTSTYWELGYPIILLKHTYHFDIRTDLVKPTDLG